MDDQYHVDVGKTGERLIALDSNLHNGVFEAVPDEDAAHLGGRSCRT